MQRRQQPLYYVTGFKGSGGKSSSSVTPISNEKMLFREMDDFNEFLMGAKSRFHGDQVAYEAFKEGMNTKSDRALLLFRQLQSSVRQNYDPIDRLNKDLHKIKDQGEEIIKQYERLHAPPPQPRPNRAIVSPYQYVMNFCTAKY